MYARCSKPRFSFSFLFLLAYSFRSRRLRICSALKMDTWTSTHHNVSKNNDNERQTIRWQYHICIIEGGISNQFHTSLSWFKSCTKGSSAGTADEASDGFFVRYLKTDFRGICFFLILYLWSLWTAYILRRDGRITNVTRERHIQLVPSRWKN